MKTLCSACQNFGVNLALCPNDKQSSPRRTRSILERSGCIEGAQFSVTSWNWDGILPETHLSSSGHLNFQNGHLFQRHKGDHRTRRPNKGASVRGRRGIHSYIGMMAGGSCPGQRDARPLDSSSNQEELSHDVAY